MKHVLRAFIAFWKPRRAFGRIREQISENLRRSRGFSPGYEATEHMFHFFRLFKENDDLRSAWVYFNLFHKTVNFHYLETANHIALVIFVFHSAMKTLVDQWNCTYYPNYFIKLNKSVTGITGLRALILIKAESFRILFRSYVNCE